MEVVNRPTGQKDDIYNELNVLLDELTILSPDDSSDIFIERITKYSNSLYSKLSKDRLYSVKENINDATSEYKLHLSNLKARCLDLQKKKYNQRNRLTMLLISKSEIILNDFCNNFFKL